MAAILNIGAPETVSTTAPLSAPTVVALSSTKNITLWARNDSGTYRIRAQVNTYSGGSWSSGTAVDINGSLIPYGDSPITCSLLDTDSLFATWGDPSNVYGVALSISGTTISYGTAATVTSLQSGYPYDLATLTTTTAAIVYTASPTVIAARLITVTGTAFSTSSADTLASGSFSQPPRIDHLGSSKILVSHCSGPETTCRFGVTTYTTSFSSITWTTDTTLMAAGSEFHGTRALSSTLAAAIRYNSSDDEIYAYSLSISGSTVTVNDVALVADSTYMYQNPGTCAVTNDTVVIVYSDDTATHRALPLEVTASAVTAGTAVTETDFKSAGTIYEQENGTLVTVFTDFSDISLAEITVTIPTPRRHDLLTSWAQAALTTRRHDLLSSWTQFAISPRRHDLLTAWEQFAPYPRRLDMLSAWRQAEVLDTYRLYHAEDEAAMDFTTPIDTTDALPFTHAPAANKRHRYVVRAVNRFGVETLNVDEHEITLDAAGDPLYAVPTAPTSPSATAGQGGAVTIRANYSPSIDAYPATEFALWITTNGTDPVATGTPDATVTVSDRVGIAILETTSTYADATVVKAIIATRRLDGATYRVSAPSAIVTATADATAPATPRATAFVGSLAVE